MSQSSNLYRLQQIDSQIDQIRTRIAEIDKILTQDEELQQAQSALDDANQALSEQQKLLRHAEDEVKNLKLKLEQTEATLYGGKVRNPKELQDLQAESAALKRHLTTLEDRELEAMLSLETAEDKEAASGNELIAVQSRLAGQFALLNGEKSSLSERLAHLETDRQVASGMLAGDVLTIYEQLRKQRRGIAVAKAVDKSCSACGSALSPSLIQQAVTAPVLVRCPTCGRIIYPG
jgi:hypothetical protein